MQRIKKILQFLLLLSLLFYILRMASPYIVYLFFPAYIAYFGVLSIFALKERKYKDLIKTLKEFKLIVFLGVLILTGIAITGFNGFRGILGIVNFLILYSYVFGFILLNPDKESFLLSIREFEKYFVYAGVALSVLGLIKLFFVLKGLPYPDKFSVAVNSSLDKDYNFFALTVILSFLLVAIRKANVEMKYSKVLLQVLMYILFLSVIFTGSRRGFLAITIISIFIFLVSFFGNYLNLFRIKLIGVFNAKLFSVLAILSVVLSISFFNYSSSTSRNKFVLNSGLSPYKSRLFITSTLLSFYSIINPHSEYSILYDELWDSEFDPKSPFSGWGKGSFTPVYTIEGDNSGIVPPGSVGYLIDKNSNWTTRSGYALHRIQLSDSIVNQGDYYNATVYCYVSQDFNGNSVRFFAEGAATRINRISTYDLTKKGQWQKLSLSYFCKDGTNSVVFSLTKNAPFEPDSINGHVIIAYPQVTKGSFNPKDPASGWGIRSMKYTDINETNELNIPLGTKGYVIDKDAGGYYFERARYSISGTPIFDFELNGLKRISLSVNCYASEDFDGEAWITLSNCNTEKYNISKKGTWQKLNVACEVDSGNYRADLYVIKRGVKDFSSLKGQVIFAYPEFKIEFTDGSYWDVNGMHYPDSTLSFAPLRFSNDFYSSSFIPSQGVKDIMRNFLHADTVEVVDYQNIYSENKFAGSRLDRWRYAMKIYKSYPWWKKLIGGGFAYHSMYGKTFLGDERLEGYPHNPLLSALLYSGVLGFLLYLFFLLKSVYLYYKHIKDIGYLFVAYAIVAFFCFFSSDIHFSIPIFALLSIVPFIYSSLKTSR